MFEPSTDPIIVSARINAPIATAWECYTQPQHITQWNFADPSLHCPHAENAMEVGGRYLARMEAKDG
ncbi:MAG: SRPBCC domain-containing protein, partial [Candidatus Kapaibacterium sp.]